ncbi:TIGR01777 family protein [Pedobacter sp. HDW13]|uniref:TIGR01777 family oxidoreductase n=1 Tax=unclassified Pedobacter TaxID=2628915 RepID=UPI000F5B8077|nr:MULTISPECIES: TIGR01777 family oxidoreductase [unclassified Pedobacter]QIL39240.1 TIGR01777 family protein [Pedobacter sp. HDW13]RQO65669.1 TIGR01777 family protein [Pedobacter sp. KBW01]
MKYRKIVLAGGNGYLGGVLAKHLSLITDEIVILSRKAQPKNGNVETIVWDGKTTDEWTKALKNADLLVNLCGKNVNCRYTAKNREEIIQSRLQPTTLLEKVIQKMDNPPNLWINISSATIYRHAEDRYQDEINGEIGTGFSVEVCKAWESSFFENSTPHTRKIALRTGIVLGKEDGAFPRLLNLTRTGMGGRQGNGEQYVSWVHEQDVALCIEWLLEQEKISGIINCTAPEPVKNHVLMSQIRKTCGINFGLPTPAWLLAIGAKIIGTETELILKSRWVKPTILLNNDFEFKHPTIERAVKDILK